MEKLKTTNANVEKRKDELVKELEQVETPFTLTTKPHKLTCLGKLKDTQRALWPRGSAQCSFNLPNEVLA